MTLSAWAAEPSKTAPPASVRASDVAAGFFDLSLAALTTQEKAPPMPPSEAPKSQKPSAPLPFHTIEGYGGGSITPTAYLVNPGPKDKIFGLPALEFTYTDLGSKNLQAITVTETLFARLELGYGADRLDLGSLPADLEKVSGIDLDESEVWLHNFNARFLVLEENAFGQNWLPATTVGVHFKYNADIASIARQFGALSIIGYERSNGQDFTLTCSKTFPKTLFDRPLLVSAGLRLSQGAQIGFEGFSDEWSATFEGNVGYLPLDWLLLGYEFRQNPTPYREIPGLIGDADNWHVFSVGLIFSTHATMVVGYGRFGTLANAEVNNAWSVQLKLEF